jgi:hypothetical protein
MAVGDLGASKGLRITPNTKAINLGYDDLNQKADEIAAEQIARVAADDLLRARTPVIKVQSTPLTSAVAVGTLRFW